MSTNNGKWKVFVFDFDGVLVDSYSCLPSVYDYIAQYVGLEGKLRKKFIEKAIRLEDEQDALGNYEKRTWWPILFREFGISIDESKLNQLIEIFWNKRAEQSKIIENCENILKLLKKKGKILIIMAGNDGIVGMKKRRIEKSGLAHFFDEIFVVGEDIKDRIEGINLIIRKYNVAPNQIVVVDDKPSPINEINRKMKDITTVKVEFKGVLKLAWSDECEPNFRIKKIGELWNIIK